MSIKRSSTHNKVRSNLTAEELLTELANCEDHEIKKFRKKWDPVFAKYSFKTRSNEEVLSRRDELKLLWTTVHCHLGSKVTEDSLANAVVPYVTTRTRWLLDRCEEQCLPSLEGYICEYWLRREKTGWKVVWQPKKKIMKADPRNLPALLAMTCIHHANQLGFCRNQECPAPYFFSRRRDQRFCSEGCAWPAKKAAKLKWWREHRGKGNKMNSTKKARKK